jgi:hypothetical protein
MSDQLYLSLWYPNFRLDSLPAALTGVLRQFALIAKDGQPTSALGRVAAASVYPIDWTESPTYQRIYVNDDRAADSADTEGSIIENAVAEATEQLHDDCAYEFEMRWMLWLPDPDAADEGFDTAWHLERAAAERIQQNVEKLLAFTLSVEKHCGISSRLLWTESGEPLAEKLIARLQRLN